MGVLDLSHKSENPPQDCEVRVDISQGDDWVRIPVTKCELWINKDGPADITRSAKVKFPGEWGGENILQYMNGFQPSEELLERVEFDQCRIWFKDPGDDVYQVVHYGYVGGIGPAAENGVYKLWVYDVADLMRRIRVSKSWGQPTIQDVLNFVLRGRDDDGRGVGIEQRSSFDDIQTYVAGVQGVNREKLFISEREEQQIADVAADLATGNFGEFFIEDELPYVGPFQIRTDDLVADVFDWAKDNLIDPLLTGQRRFQLNRHNMVDMMDWFAAEVGAKWHFEPTPNGPILFFDNRAGVEEPAGLTDSEEELSRRKFVDVEALDDADVSLEQSFGDISDFRDMAAFDTITTLDNQALYDIKPINSLTLYGETHDPAQYNASAFGPGPPAPGTDIEEGRPPAAPIRSSRFPRVQVRYPPLIKRAGGYEYEPPAIDSDKVSLEQARAQARKEFRKYLEESTEGTITIRGNPYIVPHDYVTTLSACDGIYPNVEEPPMTYEVNGVKHMRGADTHYETELDVSLTYDETLLEVTGEYVDA